MFRQFLSAGIRAAAAKLVPGYRSPLGVYVTLTAQCNLQCGYCGFTRLKDRYPDEFSYDEMKELLAAMAAAGVTKLNLTGGEPLLHERLGDIIALARNHGMFVAVSTNGLLVETRGEQLAGADMVMVSFDGRREHHDARRGAGTHDRVLAALTWLAQRRVRFWTTTLLQRDNLDDIDYIIATAARFGSQANFVLLQYLPAARPENSLPAREEVSTLMPDSARIRETFNELLRRKREGAPIGASVPFLEMMARWPDYDRLMLPEQRGVPCYAGRLYCHLSLDRKLYACGHCIGALPGEPLRPGGFRAAFDRLQRLPGCNSCRVACDTENNLIYDLRLSVLLNWLGKLRR